MGGAPSRAPKYYNSFLTAMPKRCPKPEIRFCWPGCNLQPTRVCRFRVFFGGGGGGFKFRASGLKPYLYSQVCKRLAHFVGLGYGDP